MKTNAKRSPLDRAQPLRAAGQSLTEQLQDEAYDHIFAPAMLALLFLMLAGLEWFRYFNDSKPNPVIFSVAAGLGVLYAVVKIWRARDRKSVV